MPGIFNRVKVWGATDVLTAADLNAEFDNIIQNFIPQMMQGYSTNVSQMQIQTSPGSVGNESLATTLSGEIERLRFQIAAITGNTFWYSAPGASIAQLVSALGTSSLANKVASGLTNGVAGSQQPIYLQPSGTVNSLTLKGSVTPLSYSIAGATYTISTDVTVTSLTTAPTAGNTCIVNDTAVDNSARTKLLGENGSVITVATMGVAVSALVGQIAAFKTASATAEYIIGRVESSTQITQAFRGYFFNSSNALMGRQTVNNGDTLTLMKLTWLFVNTTGGVAPVYNNPRVAGIAPSSPSTGDYWFDTVANFWKIYTGTAWIQANATLAGVCIQDTTKTVGARSADFFAAFSDLNTAELFTESVTEVRSLQEGAQVSVYGNIFNYNPDFIRWDTPGNNDSGVTVSANNYYYLYVNTQGSPLISDVAPYDRRPDLRGYYHPANTYRCLGFVYCNASGNFDTIESFYRTNQLTAVTTMTSAVANFPLPYGLSINEQIIMLDATGGAFTQVVPPPYQWKGRTLTYCKKDSSVNKVTLQAWGQLILSTTGTVVVGSNIIATLASTAGVTAGMLVTGPGVPPNTVVTAASTTTVTMGSNAYAATVGANYSFANSTGLNGFFQTKLCTQLESVTLYSDGINTYIMSRAIPSVWQNYGSVIITATTTSPTKNATATDNLWGRRIGNEFNYRYEYRQTAGGNNGSGDYLYALLPSSIGIIDLSVLTLSTTGVGTGAFLPRNGVGVWNADDTSTFASGLVSVFDASRVRLLGITGAGTQGAIGSGNLGLAATGGVGYVATGALPVVDWSS